MGKVSFPLNVVLNTDFKQYRVALIDEILGFVVCYTDDPLKTFSVWLEQVMFFRFENDWRPVVQEIKQYKVNIEIEQEPIKIPEMSDDSREQMLKNSIVN